MSEEGVDAYWQETFRMFNHREFDQPGNLSAELLRQFQICLVSESPDPGTLKQLGYYLDFACQILHLESADYMRDAEKCKRVITFIEECRALLNAALAKTLPECHWQRIAHYAENQLSRKLLMYELVERQARRNEW